MTDPIIKVEGLSKRYELGAIGTGTFYGDFSRQLAKWFGKEDPFSKIGERQGSDKSFWALDDISFELMDGDVLGVIGKNGAGKSTLLKILSRTTSPTKGGAKIYGRIASLLEVGTGFHPELSGRENIFLNGAILGMTTSEIKMRFDEIVDFAGVEKFVDTPVKRYSSGMYVRLAFAVAAHLEPEILIVDEVLSVGDAEFQRKCIGKMQSVSRNDGRTVLFVSHNLSQINQICNKGLLLKSGKLDFFGSIEQAVSRYAGIEDNSHEVDTSNLPRMGVKNNDFTINKLKIICGEKDKVYENNQISLQIHFHTNFEIKELVLGFVIRDALDNHLLEPRSTSSLFPLNVPKGDYMAQVDFLLNLRAGVYTLGLGARHLKGSLEYIPFVTQIEVLPTNSTGEEWNKHNAGIFSIDSKWSITSNN